ncbi:hypothetical protein PMI07_000494 [Rhizobium sp. CF080]|uniref:hypothetical protein n=1 Tax=Rhizobium sp. (strain CF080) TaxID=1144310 RepID=UPI000271C4AF|nr:hypothetical protein [Rhizobium sp. CF080]EUB97934.1 hypothetical protein PMI07_000494 [Rhizobium sp. CF080]
MKITLRNAVIAIIFTCGSVVAHASSGDASVNGDLNKELSSFERIDDLWLPVDKETKSVAKRYRNAERMVARCKRGTWSVFFESSFVDLDKSRKELEKSHSLIKASHKSALTSMSGHRRSLAILEGGYNSKGKDEAYWTKKNDIITKMALEYRDIITNSVIPAYELYNEGIDALSEAYSDYASDCLGVIPLKPGRDILEAVLAKVDIVGGIATKIVDLLPKSIVKKE